MDKDDTGVQKNRSREQALKQKIHLKRYILDEKRYMMRAGKRAMVRDPPNRVEQEYSKKRRNEKERLLFLSKDWERFMKTMKPRAENIYLPHMTRAEKRQTNEMLPLPFIFAQHMFDLYQTSRRRSRIF